VVVEVLDVDGIHKENGDLGKGEYQNVMVGRRVGRKPEKDDVLEAMRTVYITFSLLIEIVAQGTLTL
jgi:hypothetical protein